MVTERLSEFILRELILEGGLAGHMSTPIDFPEFTGDDLKELVESLFSGKIEHMKEKLDGTNLNAYRDLNGETVFIRNQADLNSEKGGMSLEEISVRYFDKPGVAENFIKAAKVIEQVFERVPVKFFNPEDGVKVVVNCECISAGKTNVIIYSSDRVAFHGTSTYTLNDITGKWQLTDANEGIPKEIEKAAEGFKSTEPRPDLIVKSVEQGKKMSDLFCKYIDKLFSDEGLSTSATIDEWKHNRFLEFVPDWLDPEDVYRRWFYGDKSIGLNQLKKKYSEKLSELKKLDQVDFKDIVRKTIEPLDRLIMKIGNTLIECLEGFTNSGNFSEVSAQLKSDYEQLVSEIKSNATEDEMVKLEVQIARLDELDNVINAAEGVVFTYKGKLMKLTGSFSALNQIMGLRKFSR